MEVEVDSTGGGGLLVVGDGGRQWWVNGSEECLHKGEGCAAKNV